MYISSRAYCYRCRRSPQITIDTASDSPEYRDVSFTEAGDWTDEIDLLLTSATTLAKTLSNIRITNVACVAAATDDRPLLPQPTPTQAIFLPDVTTAQMNVVRTSELGPRQQYSAAARMFYVMESIPLQMTYIFSNTLTHWSITCWLQSPPTECSSYRLTLSLSITA